MDGRKTGLPVDQSGELSENKHQDDSQLDITRSPPVTDLGLSQPVIVDMTPDNHETDTTLVAPEKKSLDSVLPLPSSAPVFSLPSTTSTQPEKRDSRTDHTMPDAKDTLGSENTEIHITIAEEPVIPKPIHPTFSDEESPPLLINDETEEEETNQSCCTLSSLYHFVPFAEAAREAADIAMSLHRNPTATLAEKITGPIAALGCSYEFSDPSSTKNFREFCQTIKTRKRPKDWPAITPGRQKAAIGIMAASSPYGMFSDALQAYWFFDAIRTDYDLGNSSEITSLFKVGGIAIGIGAGTNKFFTDNYEALKITWRLLSQETSNYANTFSKIVSPVLGYSLSALKTVQDEVQGYIAIKTIFGVESVPVKCVIGGFAGYDALPNFCFSGITNLNTFDELFGYVGKCKFEPKKIAAMTISLSLSIYLAYLKRPLNLLFYQDVVSSDFNINQPDITDPALETFSWLMMAQEAIQYSASLYPSSYVLVDKTTNRICQGASWLYGKISSFCCYFGSSKDKSEREPLLADQEDYDEEEDVLPHHSRTVQEDIESNPVSKTDLPSHYQDGNSSLLFNPKQKSASVTPRREQQRTCALI